MTEATSARLPFAGGWSNSLIPVAQFNPHEKLDEPIMHAGGEGNAYKLWREPSDEHSHYRGGAEDELIGRVRSSTP